MAKAASPTRFPPPSEVRLKRLLARGYFPAELPPPFGSTSFAAQAGAFSKKWEEKEILKFWTKPEHFSSPRYGHARRVLSIVNPVNQLLVCNIIASNWYAIRQRLKRSEISEFDPQIALRGPGRAVTGVNFDGVARRRAEILAKYGRYVKTDIARFYPSIYTHAIPWSVMGKDQAKKTMHEKSFKDSYSNRLDAAVRAGQQGQTIGIPIGPDSSRIISELIAVEVEQTAETNIDELTERAVRYVDDILIGISDHETPSAVLKGLSAALYDFELEINAEKTVTVGLGHPHAPEWIHYIRSFQISSNIFRQREDLDSYFEQAIYLADVNMRDNVMLFAARRAASFPISNSNYAHLVRWLLYSARRSPSCLSFVAEHLAAIADKIILPNEEIHAYILQQLPIKAEAAHTDEVCWLLFWAMTIKLMIPASLFDNIKKLRSSVLALLTLDIRDRGLVTGSLRLPEWHSSADSDGLKSELWLLAYESTKKGWWRKRKSSSFIMSHQFFGDVWRSNVEFYDRSMRPRKSMSPTFMRSSSLLLAGMGGQYP